jgi:hypothetical protein
MASRGRKSAKELEIIPNRINVLPPDAPYNLSDAEVSEWDAMVNSQPAAYFAREHYQTLVQYCRHKVTADRLSLLLHQCTDPKDFVKLARAQAVESREITNCLRTMRLTHHAVIRADAKREPKHAQVPWIFSDVEGDEGDPVD